MMGRIRNWLLSRMARRRLRKENGLHVPCDIVLRLPQYCHIAEDAVLGSGCRLMCWDSYMGKPTGFVPRIVVGKRFHATRGLSVQCANHVVIGNDVPIASNVTLIDYDHGIDPTEKNYLDTPLSVSDGIEIGNGVRIGENCLILGGVRIGEKSIVGGGSVVTRSVPPYTIVAGNPAKIVKRYDHGKKQWIRADEEL